MKHWVCGTAKMLDIEEKAINFMRGYQISVYISIINFISSNLHSLAYWMAILTLKWNYTQFDRPWFPGWWMAKSKNTKVDDISWKGLFQKMNDMLGIQ